MLEANIALYIYSNVLLISVLIASSKSKKKNTSDKLFNLALIATIWMLFFDLISRFEGLDMSFYPVLTHVGNFFLFLFNPLVGIIWFLYIHYEIYSNDRAVRKLGFAFLPYVIFNAILTIGSLFYGWLYSIDQNNIYHRGPLYLIPEVINMIIILSTFVMLTIERKRFTMTHYHLYLTFGLFPIAALITQSIYYGLSYTLNAIALSITILYVSVQNKHMKSDYLTSTFNRRQLDYYVEDRIKAAKKHGPFTAIFVDVDDFKQINDTYGHPIGDEALIKTAKILRSSISLSDFFARFGGDEFYIVTNTCDKEEINKMIEKMLDGFRKFNEESSTYQLHVSIGYCVYERERHNSITDFQMEVDRLLYSSKQSKV